MMIVHLLTAVSLALQSAGADSLALASPFADFETHRMPNGLKVWYKHLPDDPVVSISVALPFGADQDPAGKEQLAHFTEHMLFSDQPGRTEEEIKRDIEERGGLYNASVTPDRTFFFVRIGREHAVFALEWLSNTLAPHGMNPDVVERQREPVALEVRARPRQFFDWLLAYFINPPVLRTPDFWEREFGLETRASRDYYPFRSLYSITSEDLREFYDTYYVPSLMTLTVVGDIDRDSLLEKVAQTFASLPDRVQPETAVPLRDPGRYRQSVFWAYSSSVYYSNRFKFYDMTAEQDVMLIFISRLLGKRLNDQLRFGDRKATYGIGVGIVKRAGATVLQVSGGIKPDEFEFARGVVERELDALRRGGLAPDEFEADRAAVTRQLKVTNTAPDDLEGWVRNSFFDPRVHDDFPDLAGAFEAYTQEEVQAFARQYLVPERQVLTIIRPHPITQGVLSIFIAVIAWLTVRFTGARLIRPLDMTRIRYVARLRLPGLYRVVALAVLAALVAVSGRLLIYVFQLAADTILVPLDSFVVQWLAYGGMLVASVFLLVQVPARLPRKLLVFDDRILIKYLSFRSTPIHVPELQEISLLRFPEVWLSRRLWKCVPLSFGLFAPAVYLKRQDGWGYFFSVREKDELVHLLKQIAPAAHTSSSSSAEPDNPAAPA
ncbi:MAG: insulinase family protein [Gemmatimonadota bacterium]|nr:MAG: insulinase family protein [Gemmatimonadota bacterium]